MAPNVRRGATGELEVYEISDLVIDVARQRVTRAAAEIPLPKLSFDLLLVLIRAAPALVSNDDLMAQVEEEPRAKTRASAGAEART